MTKAHRPMRHSTNLVFFLSFPATPPLPDSLALWPLASGFPQPLCFQVSHTISIVVVACAISGPQAVLASSARPPSETRGAEVNLRFFTRSLIVSSEKIKIRHIVSMRIAPLVVISSLVSICCDFNPRLIKLILIFLQSIEASPTSLNVTVRDVNKTLRWVGCSSLSICARS